MSGLERETKLVALPGRPLGDVWAACLRLGCPPRETPRSLPLAARYHEGQGGELRQLGVSLRSRTEGDREVAAMKGPGPVVDGVRTRLEIEVPLAGVPRVGDPLPVTLQEALARAGAQVLRWPPVAFETRILRIHAPMDLPTGAPIMLCIDVGEVLAGTRRDPVAELELEELAPSGPALLQMTLDLADVLDLRPGVRTKAARGLRLLGLLGPHRAPGRGRLDAVESLIDLEERRIDGDDLTSIAASEIDALAGVGAPEPALVTLLHASSSEPGRAAALRILLRWAGGCERRGPSKSDD